MGGSLLRQVSAFAASRPFDFSSALLTAPPLAPPLQGVAISLVWFALGALVCYTVQQAGGGTGVASTALAAFGADRHHALPCTWPSSKATAKRKNLVFAAVGDGWTADK